MFYTKMIRHLGKPQIRELEKTFGSSIRAFQLYEKNSITNFIGVREKEAIEITQEGIQILKKITQEEGYDYKGVYTHNNKKSYLFSKEIKWKN